MSETEEKDFNNQTKKMMNPLDVNSLLEESLTLEKTIKLLKLCVKFPDDKQFIQSVIDKTRGSEFLDKAANVVNFDRTASDLFPTVDEDLVRRIKENKSLLSELEERRMSDSPEMDEEMAAYISIIDKEVEEDYLVNIPKFKPKDIMSLGITKQGMLEMGDKISLMESQRILGDNKTNQKETSQDKPAPSVGLKVEKIEFDESVLEGMKEDANRKPVIDNNGNRNIRDNKGDKDDSRNNIDDEYSR